jgi:hypothetical protein
VPSVVLLAINAAALRVSGKAGLARAELIVLYAGIRFALPAGPAMSIWPVEAKELEPIELIVSEPCHEGWSWPKS